MANPLSRRVVTPFLLPEPVVAFLNVVSATYFSFIDVDSSFHPRTDSCTDKRLCYARMSAALQALLDFAIFGGDLPKLTLFADSEEIAELNSASEPMAVDLVIDTYHAHWLQTFHLPSQLSPIGTEPVSRLIYAVMKKIADGEICPDMVFGINRAQSRINVNRSFIHMGS
ncbi:hypothetical protein H696_05636 [Fonticula alba]|uniref:Uncharacterized protein n=1 Tax=Fonticula alba TaxID=691883 RepID=A0A058Z1V1_FONAL|nr:hypothetical protein H696_05636 [Fonticula alba]KCV67908.1 hypothetical protein H696_05636 [Fonticula alba]|eukprot:XP_009497728.1 hypothetical protein H696_05636 [Fonticula alba]